MPTKRDPFADKRKRSNGVAPKQVTTQRNRKASRDHKRKLLTTKKLEAAKKELSATERKLEIKKQMLALMDQAPTPAQQRKLIWATFEELGFNPITELIECVNQIDDPKDKANIIEKLSSMVISKPKSVDIQAEIQGGLQISVMDFSRTTQKELREMSRPTDPVDQAIDVTPENDDTIPEEYMEFESEEDRHKAASAPDSKDPAE